MNPLATRSVQQKLLVIVLLATLVALLVAVVAMVAYDLRLYHRSWIADLTTQAELLGRTSAPALTFDDARVAKENLDLLRFRPKVRSAGSTTPRGGFSPATQAKRAGISRRSQRPTARASRATS